MRFGSRCLESLVQDVWFTLSVSQGLVHEDWEGSRSPVQADLSKRSFSGPHNTWLHEYCTLKKK